MHLTFIKAQALSLLNPAVLALAPDECWYLILYLAKKRLQLHAVLLCIASCLHAVQAARMFHVLMLHSALSCSP